MYLATISRTAVRRQAGAFELQLPWLPATGRSDLHTLMNFKLLLTWDARACAFAQEELHFVICSAALSLESCVEPVTSIARHGPTYK